MIKTILAVVGGVVVIAVTLVVTIKVIGKYGNSMIKVCKAADKAISTGIRRIA